MIETLIGIVLLGLFLWAALFPTPSERARQRSIEKLLAATPSRRGQKLNPAGVAAIPVATSSILPEPPPPPSGRGCCIACPCRGAS